MIFVESDGLGVEVDLQNGEYSALSKLDLVLNLECYTLSYNVYSCILYPTTHLSLPLIVDWFSIQFQSKRVSIFLELLSLYVCAPVFP